MSIDWRNFDGLNYVTGPRNQGGSNFCWGFATTALIECQSRIEHGNWCVRSEGDLFNALGNYHFKGGDPVQAGDTISSRGIADPDCLPWFDRETTYSGEFSASPDRKGRTVQAPKLVALNTVAAQKLWLDIVGPIACIITVFSDFSTFYGSGIGVYSPSSGATTDGATHVLLVVGYDEAAGCWLLKNSWGASSSHSDAVCRFAYGMCGIDTSPKYGVRGVNPDPNTRRRQHSGGLLVSGNGALSRNLELVVNSGGQFTHYFKDPGGGWVKVQDFGAAHPYILGQLASDVSLTQTTFGRNFEVAGNYTMAGSQLNTLRHWTYLQSIQQWHPATPQGFGPSDTVGAPAFIQTNLGQPGSFDVVVRNNANRLFHLRRNNARPWTNAPLGEWKTISEFASGVESGPAIVQGRSQIIPTRSNVDWPQGEEGRGDFHVFCISKGFLEHWVYELSTWQRYSQICANASGQVQAIEGTNGWNEWSTGPLHVFVVVDGSVELWSRESLARANPWQKKLRFGQGVMDVLGAAQGHRGVNGLDVVVRKVGGGLEHFVVLTRPGRPFQIGRGSVIP
jgi:Papain family cysteine protease